MREDQKEKLEIIKEASGTLKIMHGLKEEFTEIFDQSENWSEGTLKLADGLRKSKTIFQKNSKDNN